MPVLRPPLASFSLVAIALLVAACGAQASPTPPPSPTPAPSAAQAATPVPTLPPTPSPVASVSPTPTRTPTRTPTPTVAPTPSVPAPTTSAAASEAQARIDEMRARLRADPTDGQAYLSLGAALLQRVRETGDPALYDQADEALAKARELRPDDPSVLIAIGVLQLARHQFADALETGRAALAIAPIAEARGVVVDALTELGRYDEAVEELQRMVDQKPNLASFSRVSYARELRGDLEGALEALDLAEEAGAGVAENLAFVEALKGNLLTFLGRPVDAAAAYQRALTLFPNYAPALAGQGRLAVGRGDLETAIQRFRQAAAILPFPEYVVALGEAQLAAGDADAARRSFELVRFETQLFAASGVAVDLELALFEADHGDPAAALKYAQIAYGERRTTRTADALAWASFRAGKVAEAKVLVEESLALGTQDPLLLYHAGAIAAASGDAATARERLERALTLDPGFSATGAADARALLDELP